MYNPDDDAGYRPDAPAQGNWWEGPPPAGYSGQWPPPLPTGAHYGPLFGQIIYGPNTGIAPPVADPVDFGNPPTDTGGEPPPTTTPPPTTGAPPAATDYDFNAARAKIEAAIGRALTDDDIAYAFKTWGGNLTSRFTDAGIAPVIAHFKGSGGGGTPPPQGPQDPQFPTAPPTGPGGITLPKYNTPDPYKFEAFKAPTAADILNDPSYQFRFDQGQKSLEKSRTAAGIINTGDTAKALLGYGQDFASQEYKNVWDRDLGAWNANEDRRFNAYLTNVQTQNDTPYKNDYTTVLDQRRAEEFNYSSAYNQWVDQYNQWRNNKNDAFDQRWKVASS